jgi:anti-anti-sigma factor
VGRHGEAHSTVGRDADDEGVFERVAPLMPPPGRAVRWLRATRDLDVATEARARVELRDASSGDEADPTLVVLFVSGCFVAVRGLAVLLEISAELASRGGQLIVVRPPRSLRRTLEILNLEGSFVVAHTLSQAAALAGGPHADR